MPSNWYRRLYFEFLRYISWFGVKILIIMEGNYLLVVMRNLFLRMEWWVNRGGNDLSILIELEIYIRHNPESRDSRDHAQSNKECNSGLEVRTNFHFCILRQTYLFILKITFPARSQRVADPGTWQVELLTWFVVETVYIFQPPKLSFSRPKVYIFAAISSPPISAWPWNKLKVTANF